MFLVYLTSVILLSDLARACEFVEMKSNAISDKSLSNEIQFRLKVIPANPATIYFESPDLDFNACGVVFSQDNYNTFQTVQAQVKPTFHEVSPSSRDSFIKIGWGPSNETRCIFPVTITQSPSAICVASGDPHVEVRRF